MQSPKKIFQKILQSNYNLAKIYHEAKVLALNFPSKNHPIIVHQMGKVASTSIYESLKTLNLEGHSFYHTHYLSDSGFRRSENFYRENYHRIKAIHPELMHSFYIRKNLSRFINSNEKIKVITLVRDPVAKNVSSFFQNLEYLFDLSLSKKKQMDGIENSLERLRGLFLERFPGHRVPLEWFDSELKSVFGIDVFKAPFPMKKGYWIYEDEHTDILLLKLEKLNEVIEEAFEEFLKIKKFRLKAENVGENKKYAQLYKEFKGVVSLPEDYLDEMYSSKYVRHFYSCDEIDSFRKKWAHT